MRRDLCYFYPLPVNQVFDAFYRAANQKFGKQCQASPFKSLSFGLNYSFKYNMNGGSVTAHFMPYQNGTAINLRYTIIQAFGARYQAHANDYISFINGLLGVQAGTVNINVQQFLDYEASVSAGAPQQSIPPQQAPQQPVQQPVQQQGSAAKFCTKCGAPVAGGANFCTKCGNKLN